MRWRVVRIIKAWLHRRGSKNCCFWGGGEENCEVGIPLPLLLVSFRGGIYRRKPTSSSGRDTFFVFFYPFRKSFILLYRINGVGEPFQSLPPPRRLVGIEIHAWIHGLLKTLFMQCH